MYYDEEFLKCVERWVDKSVDFDDRIYHAFDAYSGLFERIDEKQRVITINLLRRFSYYNRESVNRIIASLSQKAKEEFNLKNDNSVVSVVRKKDGRIGSSIEYTMIHQNVGAFSNDIHYQDLRDIKEEQWPHINNVILVDDYSGTGETIINYLTKWRKKFKQKKVIIIVVETMFGALKNIKKYAQSNRLDIEVISFEIKDKAFKNEKESIIKEFEKLSGLLKIPSYFIKGRHRTESLVAFFNNTPNNTLGMFWYNTKNNVALFPRKKDEKPQWQTMKKEKNKRKKFQYESKSE